MRCRRCGQSLLHSQVQAGSPLRGFWVTYDDGHFGFDCPSGPGGHEPAPVVELPAFAPDLDIVEEPPPSPDRVIALCAVVVMALFVLFNIARWIL